MGNTDTAQYLKDIRGGGSEKKNVLNSLVLPGGHQHHPMLVLSLSRGQCHSAHAVLCEDHCEIDN